MYKHQLRCILGIVIAMAIALILRPGFALADPVITEGDTWIQFQDETDHLYYTITVQSAYVTPSADNPATCTIEATSKDGNETVCAFKAGTLSGGLFDDDSGAAYGTPGTPTAAYSTTVTEPGWCYIGCKSSDLNGNPVTADMSFQLPMEGGSGPTTISLAGTTVTPNIYSKNAVADWTLNFKPATDIEVKTGDKLTLQATGAMFQAVSGVTSATDSVTGLELASQCKYSSEGKPDLLHISFTNTAPATIPASGAEFKISGVVNPNSAPGAVCTTTPTVNLDSAEHKGQVNAPPISFSDATLNLVLSKSPVNINADGQVLDDSLTAAITLNDSGGNILSLDKEVKIRVKNAPTTSINGIGGSCAWQSLYLSAGTGTFAINSITDSEVREGSFTRTIEVKLADNPYLSAEADLTVAYHNSCKITGRLVDEDTGQPVAGARMAASNGDVFYTGEDGRFEVLAATGQGGNLNFTRDDYVDLDRNYAAPDLSGDNYDMGDVKFEHYEFKVNVIYAFSAATQDGPAAPAIPDDYYGPYGNPYLVKGGIQYLPNKIRGSTCYFKKGRGIIKGDSVEVILPMKNSVKKTMPLTIGAGYDDENKVEFIDVQKGFAVIMSDAAPPAGQTGDLVGRIYGPDVKFELAPGQVFMYGKNSWELENGNYNIVVMSKEASSLLPRALDYLDKFGLVEGVDYNRYAITVADGTIAALTVAAPTGVRNTVLDGDGTTIYTRPAHNAPLTPVVVKYSLKSGYDVMTRKIIVTLPEGVDFTDQCRVYNTQDRSYEVGCQYDPATRQLSIDTQHAWLFTNLNSFVFTVQAAANASGKLTASLVYYIIGAGVDTEEVIGSAPISAPSVILCGPSSSSTADVLLKGTASPDVIVAIYDGETGLGEIIANKAGHFEGQFTLANPVAGSTHYLTAKTGSGADQKISSVLEVLYEPQLPNINRLLYQAPGVGPVELIGPNHPATFVTGWGDNMSFTVETSDDSKINKMWVVIANGDAYNSAGQPMIVPAFFDESQKQWLTGPFNGYLNEFNPGPVSVQFTLNNYVADPIEIDPLPGDFFEDPFKYASGTQEEYFNSLPEEIKNAKVNITRSGGSGVTAGITLADQAQSQFTYAVDVNTPPLSDKPGGITEEKLVELGFHKMDIEDGRKVYVKQTVNGEEIDDFIANNPISSLPGDSNIKVLTSYCICPAANTKDPRSAASMTPASDGGAFFDMGSGTTLYYPPPNGQHFSYTGESAGAWGESLYYQTYAKQPDGTYQAQMYKFNGMQQGWEPVAPENIPPDFAENNSAIPDSEMTGMGANWPSVTGTPSGGQPIDTSAVMNVFTTNTSISGSVFSNLTQIPYYAIASGAFNIIKIQIEAMTINELNEYMKLQYDTLWAMRLRTNSSGTVCYDLLSEDDQKLFDKVLQDMKDRRQELEDFSGQHASYNILCAAGGSAIPAIMATGAMPGGQVIAIAAVAGTSVTSCLYNVAVGNQQLDNFRKSAEQFAHLNNMWAQKFYLQCGQVHTVPGQTIPFFKIDPSGIAYEGTLSNPVAGVHAELWLADDSSGSNARLWAQAADYDEINPQTTSANGVYQWDVPVGWWQVRLSKDGYNDCQSEWLPVPPPQLGINLEMVPEGGTGSSAGDINKDGKVDGFDALDILLCEAQLINQISAKGKLTFQYSPAIADVNKDGSINGFDALDILFFEAQLYEQMSIQSKTQLGK